MTDLVAFLRFFDVGFDGGIVHALRLFRNGSTIEHSINAVRSRVNSVREGTRKMWMKYMD